MEPTSGFRQPTTPVDPELKIDAAPPGSLARPSSPSEHGSVCESMGLNHFILSDGKNSVISHNLHHFG